MRTLNLHQSEKFSRTIDLFPQFSRFFLSFLKTLKSKPLWSAPIEKAKIYLFPKTLNHELGKHDPKHSTTTIIRTVRTIDFRSSDRCKEMAPNDLRVPDVLAQRTREAKMCRRPSTHRSDSEERAQLVTARCVPVSLLEQMTSFPLLPLFLSYLFLRSEPSEKNHKEQLRKLFHNNNKLERCEP